MKTKNKLEEAVKRRVRAARLLQAGHTPPQVAAMVGAPRQTVYRWRDVLLSEGMDALRDMSQGGRPARLDAQALGQLQLALLEGPAAQGFDTPLWTIKRVRALVERQFGVKYSEVHIWRLLGQLGFSSQKPDRRALERDDGVVEHWKKRTLPSLKKKRGAKGD
jgi:transposase